MLVFGGEDLLYFLGEVSLHLLDVLGDGDYLLEEFLAKAALMLDIRMCRAEGLLRPLNDRTLHLYALKLRHRLGDK